MGLIDSHRHSITEAVTWAEQNGWTITPGSGFVDMVNKKCCPLGAVALKHTQTIRRYPFDAYEVANVVIPALGMSSLQFDSFWVGYDCDSNLAEIHSVEAALRDEKGNLITSPIDQVYAQLGHSFRLDVL